MTGFRVWGARDAARVLHAPLATDDKYSHGVLGVVTGSEAFPGAAVIGVDAALHTGVGMVRYLGPGRPAELVLARRPEAVTVPGQVQAWLVGSGMHDLRESASTIAEAFSSGAPIVVDAGALGSVAEATGPVVITPHRGELATVLGVDVSEVQADPVGSASMVAASTGAVVVLKGHTTHIVSGAEVLTVTAPTTWLATAGSGDALAGILGAMVATHSEQIREGGSALAQLAASAVYVHGSAAERAGAGGPFTILDLNAAIGAVMAQLTHGYSET